jgi:alcohol dehydrogenase class IV
MVASAVVLDPAITVHTPEWLWLSTGIRAVDHAAETLGSYRSNPICDGYAATGLRLLRHGLPRTHEDPADLEARLSCQLGAWQSILPATGGVVPFGLSHAVGHVLGGICGVPHGYTSCVMLPYVMAWNAEANPERQALVSDCFDAPGRPAGELLDAFIRGLGLPRTLPEVGVGESDFAEIARFTLMDPLTRLNPRPVETVEDVLPVLHAALEGAAKAEMR